MKHILIFISFLIFGFSMQSCVDQESILVDRYINLEEPRYFGDSLRMKKILSIHKKLLRKKPDNLIYMGNTFQMNCSLGKYEDNKKLIEEFEFIESGTLNPEVYKNFYLALNAFRSDPNSDFAVHLEKLNSQDLSHNPLLGFIAAKCTGKDDLAYDYFPQMIEYVRYMPEKMTIMKMIDSGKCERFLELYRGICPVCEICDNNYPI